MKIYHYHPTTKEFLGEGLADQDPLDASNWLIPANATDLAPPSIGINEVAIFTDSAWVMLADFRGFKYYRNDRTEQTINEIGVRPADDPDYYGEQVKPQTLTEAKDAKRVEIRKAYDEASIATVDALGFTFDGGFESAIKLDAAMRLSQAAGAGGVVFYDASNAAHQLGFADALQVCIAVAVAYQTTLAKKQDLYAQIDAATTVKKVEAIVW